MRSALTIPRNIGRRWPGSTDQHRDVRYRSDRDPLPQGTSRIDHDTQRQQFKAVLQSIERRADDYTLAATTTPLRHHKGGYKDG